MRLVLDCLIACLLLVILGIIVVHWRQTAQQLNDQRLVHQALAELHEQATFHAAMREAELGEPRFPPRIEPAWFGHEPPRNPLATPGHPWLDVAPPGDHGAHPPDPVLRTIRQAQFWYNPNRGLFRARVQPQGIERRTLALYNRLNGTSLEDLPDQPDPQRDPEPHPLARPRTASDDGDPAGPTPAPEAEPSGPEQSPEPEPRRRTLQDLSLAR